MAPRAKRPRTSSNAPETKVDGEKESNAVINDLSNLKRREELWHNDGNIVLATDKHLYRVHKSILAKQSSVFRGMFDGIGTSEDASMEGTSVCTAACSEQWEGVPVAKMVGDEDEDVYHLLMALYDRNFFRAHQRQTLTLDIFSSLVTMSTKYDISDMRTELIEYLSPFYPETLEEYDKDKTKDVFCDPDANVVVIFRILSLAKQCDAHILLPALFYACANNPLDIILHSSDILDAEDVNTIVVGREKMMKAAYEVATSILLHGKNVKCRSDECLEKRISLLITHLNYASYNPPPFPLELALDGLIPADSNARATLCKSCLKGYRDSVKVHRGTFWGDMPVVFGLGTWENVRERMKA